MSGTATTNVPAPAFSDAGFVAPAESDILAGALADLNAAFGGDLNPALSTPQGQLASTIAALVGFTNDSFLYLANQVDPAYASGRFQDAIARIYFISRNPAQPTTVQAVCSGLAGTSIPVGALAQDTAGNTYACTQAGTIPASGAIVLSFANTATGPVPCPAGTLTTIYRTVPGWDSISNATDGVLGSDAESRSAFELRRQLSTAKNSRNTNAAILGAVLGVANVLDAYVTSNDTNTAATVGGVSLAPNSLYVCVAGGAAADIAQAIFSKKPPGCSYTGSTTVTVVDSSTGYSAPYPSYPVAYTVASDVPIFFSVQILKSAAVPADALLRVQGAIAAAFAGTDNQPKAARIGAMLLASRFFAGIAALGSWAQIVAISLGRASNTLGNDLQLDIDQIPAYAAANVSFFVV